MRVPKSITEFRCKSIHESAVRSRSVPTDLFEDPDVFELSRDNQLFLVQFILHADDYGRGLAHVALLAYQLHTTVPLIEQALAALSANKLLLRYQIGERNYYVLTRWKEWETLSKPTPSKYPAPPSTGDPIDQQKLDTGSFHPNKQAEQSEGKPIGEEQQELQERDKSREGEQDKQGMPANVVAFPTLTADACVSLSTSPIDERTQQVATILHMPVTEPLRRIVEEYANDPTLSLLGEADAAKEWIENPRRNQKGQLMSPAFFRRWLKREQETRLGRQGLPRQGSTPGGTNQAIKAEHSTVSTTQAIAVPEADPYAEYIRRRERECHEEWLATQTQLQAEGGQVYA